MANLYVLSGKPLIMAHIPSYVNFTGSVLHARPIPGANQIKVHFNHGWAVMSLAPPTDPQGPTVEGTRLPPLFRLTHALMLADIPQSANVEITLPLETVIQLSYDITDGVPHYR